MQVREPTRTTKVYEFTAEEILNLLGVKAEDGENVIDARYSIYTGQVTITVSNSKA